MTSQETRAQLERFTRDTEYYEAHREELLDRYPEQWIAVYEQQVIGAAQDPDDLLEQLQGRNIPIEHAVFQRLTRKEELWILPA